MLARGVGPLHVQNARTSFRNCTGRYPHTARRTSNKILISSGAALQKRIDEIDIKLKIIDMTDIRNAELINDMEHDGTHKAKRRHSRIGPAIRVNEMLGDSGEQ